ncbi:MAG: DUF2726 domain-containing protein [Candidatus Doudnabacteria bacterium]|nr:DUF2726 domain-containing protein [Candidatus Doudnabacteria bacterium]
MIKINFWEIITSLFTTQGGHMLLLLFALLVVMAILSAIIGQKRARKYEYRVKNSVMTASENEFYSILLNLVDGQYFVFPQVHLDAFLDYKIRGQSWIGAWKHINQKSVDFLICDLESRKPLLAVELDDRSHDRENRIERDEEVGCIFKNANLSLLRIKNQREYNIEEIKQQLFELILDKQDVEA